MVMSPQCGDVGSAVQRRRECSAETVSAQCRDGIIQGILLCGDAAQVSA